MVSNIVFLDMGKSWNKNWWNFQSQPISTYRKGLNCPCCQRVHQAQDAAAWERQMDHLIPPFKRTSQCILFLGLHKLSLEITSLVLKPAKWWWDGYREVKQFPQWQKGTVPSQSGQWWKQPSALIIWGPHTIYTPENEPFVLFIPRKYLKFIDFFFLFHFAKDTQLEAWLSLGIVILSWRRCQHGLQSVTAVYPGVYNFYSTIF